MNTVSDVVVSRHIKGFERRKATLPHLFDMNFWKNQNSTELLRRYCEKDDGILEVGCLTGHHLICLYDEGYTDLSGVDFCKDAIDWGVKNGNRSIHLTCCDFEEMQFYRYYSKIILFDVLEHVHNVCAFLKRADKMCTSAGEILVLVPKGAEYFDECHVNFYPTVECLKNLLSVYFDVTECFYTNDDKIFARCTKKGGMICE